MEISIDRLYSPKEVVASNGGVLPMSLSGLYAAIERNEVPVKKIGSRIFITGKYLRSLLSEESN